MQIGIQKEIESFYQRYAKKEGISMAEARKRASQLDIEEYARKAEKYVKGRDFSDQANEEMRLYNLTMKVNRLELLKAKIGLEMVGGFDELEKFCGETLTEETMKEFERLAGILGQSITNADTVKRAQTIVNASFHNATYSERIWAHQTELKSDIERLLAVGLIQGKSSQELARSLRKVHDASRYNAQRLMVTELCRAQTEVAKQSYLENGNEAYEYLATGPRPCPVCKGLDGQVFEVSDMMPGTNAPPMHPQCHCSTAPHVDRAAFERRLNRTRRGGNAEEREASKRKYQYANTVIAKRNIDTPAYRRKFNKISDNSRVNRMVWRIAREILEHRSGSKYEDLAFVNFDTGKGSINKQYDVESRAKPNSSMLKMLRQAEPGTIIAIHNHPGSSAPSLADLIVCNARKYKFGIVACHDGSLYKYSVNGAKFDALLSRFALASMDRDGYNKTIQGMLADAGVTIEVL